MKSGETKTKAPSTLGCPIERIDASASEIFSKELTPLYSAGNRRSSFLSSICFSFYPGLGIEKKLLSDRNSKRNGAMIPVCMYARFSKRVAFKYFTIGREKCEFRAKDLSMIRPSRRKETIEVFLIMFFE